MAIDEDLIGHYMNLDKKINRAKQRITRQRASFYNQTLSSYVTTDGMEIYSKGFSVENNVIQLVDTEAASLKYIERLEFQQKHFISFFNGLPYTTKTALKSKYWHQQHITIEITEKLCMDEINEIEEAVGYHFYNGEAEQKINFNPFEEEGKFEDSFSKMLELLGV